MNDTEFSPCCGFQPEIKICILLTVADNSAGLDEHFFSEKSIVNIFLSIIFNICCGYSKELHEDVILHITP